MWKIEQTQNLTIALSRRQEIIWILWSPRTIPILFQRNLGHPKRRAENFRIWTEYRRRQHIHRCQRHRQSQRKRTAPKRQTKRKSLDWKKRAAINQRSKLHIATILQRKRRKYPQILNLRLLARVLITWIVYPRYPSENPPVTTTRSQNKAQICPRTHFYMK